MITNTDTLSTASTDYSTSDQNNLQPDSPKNSSLAENRQKSSNVGSLGTLKSRAVDGQTAGSTASHHSKFKTKLKLPPLDLAFDNDTKEAPEPTAALQSSVQAVQDQMRKLPRQSRLSEAADVGYQEFCDSYKSKQIGSFSVSGHPGTEWIVFQNQEGRWDKLSESEGEGQKVHISVAPDQLAQAVDVVAARLCQDGSPFKQFKVVNMGYINTLPVARRNSSQTQRVTLGAQITAYVHADPVTNQLSAEQLANISDAIADVETELRRANINPGTIPDSDVPLSGGYTSFRNDRNAYENAAANANDPVYRCMMTRFR